MRQILQGMTGAAAAFIFLSAPALAQYQGYSGAAAPSYEAPVTVPPAFADMTTIEEGSPPAPAAQPAPVVEQAPPDPCGAYLADARTYAFCQDRVQKTQRMQDAKKERAAASAPALAPAVEDKQGKPVIMRNGAAILYAPMFEPPADAPAAVPQK